MDLEVPAGLNPEQLGELADWWQTTSDADFQGMVPKLTEYGSGDIELMGHAMAVIGRFDHKTGAESACWFYCLGKVARLMQDYHRKVEGKEDTWHDLSVYSMMARRIREVGSWPGV